MQGRNQRIFLGVGQNRCNSLLYYFKHGFEIVRWDDCPGLRQCMLYCLVKTISTTESTVVSAVFYKEYANLVQSGKFKFL